ncbi:hypothetical protein EC968_004984 [Mortierella alpina]|nr:hypothetical protein EC968_004984 [Mortierella alpina]
MDPGDATSTSQTVVSDSAVTSTAEDATTTPPPETTTTTTKAQTTTTTSSPTIPPSSTTRSTRTRTSSSFIPPTASIPTSDTVTASFSFSTTSTLSPTGTPSDDSEAAVSTGGIIGIAVAAVVALGALGLLAFAAIRRRHRRGDHRSSMIFNSLPPNMMESRPPHSGNRPGGGGVPELSGMSRQNQLVGGAVSANTSHDLLGSHSGVDPSGYSSSEYAYGGQAVDPGVTRMYGNWDEADMGWGQQQQQYYQHAPAANQRISYMPPSEPDASQAGDRYDSEYAVRREEEAAAAAAAAAGYAHYQPYSQQHYYDEHQQQQQHQAAADAGYYDNHGDYSGMHDGYYYEQPYITAEEQDRYLQSLRQGFGPEVGAGGAAVGNLDPHPQHHPGYGTDANTDLTGGARGNYRYDEEDIPYAKDEAWSTPPPQRSLTVPSSHTASQADAAAAAGAQAMAETRDVEREAVEGADAAQRSSHQSSASTSSPQMRRSHSPQLIPSPRRAPQVLRPDPALGTDSALR